MRLSGFSSAVSRVSPVSGASARKMMLAGVAALGLGGLPAANATAATASPVCSDAYVRNPAETFTMDEEDAKGFLQAFGADIEAQIRAPQSAVRRNPEGGHTVQFAQPVLGIEALQFASRASRENGVTETRESVQFFLQGGRQLAYEYTDTFASGSRDSEQGDGDFRPVLKGIRQAMAERLAARQGQDNAASNTRTMQRLTSPDRPALAEVLTQFLKPRDCD